MGISEKMVKIPEATLAAGKTIPLIGFGTADYPFGHRPDAIKEAVLQAIELGYTHFDTAAVYQSEQPLGEAINEALRRGLIQSRNQLFITSKLWPSDAHRHLVVPALQKTLRNLGLEYVDLFLIHFPVSLKPGTSYPFDDADKFMAMDFKSVWEGMEECQELGLTKSIGVSNFTCKKLEKLLSAAKIPPAVNQVEMNPLWQQKKLREFCEEKGIHITAYAPLGAKGTPWGNQRLMESEKLLNQVAAARGKTVAQVCLRWVYEQGVSLVVKSFNKGRMKENLQIFDWKLNRDDLEKIAEISQNRGFLGNLYVSEKGPFKSISEIWDGEL